MAETEASLKAREAEAAYEAALDRIKKASRALKQAREQLNFHSKNNSSPEEIDCAREVELLANTEQSEARSALDDAKARLRAVKRANRREAVQGLGSHMYWNSQPDHPAWLHYPEPHNLPRDKDDQRWTQSFTLHERKEALAFWHEWGFVIFRDILSADECIATQSEIWDYLETRHTGVSRSDSRTYHLLPTKRYGLASEQAVFSPQCVANRQSPRLYAALDAITPQWGGSACPGSNFDSSWKESVPSPGTRQDANSIVVSQDRWCLYPPSQGQASMQTNNPGAHLDICPWEYLPRTRHDIPRRRYSIESDINRLRYVKRRDEPVTFDFRAEINCVRGEYGPHNQGVLNLVDNEENDGGTAIVPKFHKCYKAWSEALGRWEDNRVGQRRRGNAFVFANPRDPIHALMKRVHMRAGSLLLWNQMTVHGATPNASCNFRIAQFVRGFRAGEMTLERKQARAAAVRMELKQAGVLGQLTPLAEHVFGVSCEPNIGEQNPTTEK